MQQVDMDFTPRNQGTAIISDDGVYRYVLTRERLLANCPRRTLLICGLNPSTADATEDDATIRKEIQFAKRWGADRLVKVNAYAFRATDPRDMTSAKQRGVDIVGPKNDEFLRMCIEAAEDSSDVGAIILAAWGQNIHPTRQAELAKIFGDKVYCLGVNKGGTPKHTLYLPYETPRVPWVCP